ncbi:MAG: type 4a pilus biogenesis protein PilO [Peptococcaceae bacterium]|nr:type 4a pilus biogenesis protein PilO [Peptococcaceae bacterium]
MNKQKNQILFLAAVIVLGILYAYVQYLFIPEWGVLKQKTAQVSERQAYLTRMENSYKDFSALKQQSSSLKAQVSVLDKKVPKKLDKPDIMLTIYNLAKNNGLSPKSLTYEPIKDEGQYLTMGMNFSCTGPAENIYTLVDQFLKGNKYIFALDSISFTSNKDGSTANMRIVAYAYKP